MTDKWKEEFDKKFVRPYFMYPPGHIHEGSTQKEAIKDFISDLLKEQEQQTKDSIRERIDEWAKAMWEMDVFDHSDWEDFEEVSASIYSYIKGLHKS